MSTLDCHDVDRTLQSLESIFGLRRGKINSFLDECESEPSDVEVDEWPNYTLDRLSECESISTEYESTNWFHLTRAPKGTEFSEGLQPLGEALPELLSQLGCIVGDRVDNPAWDTFEREVLQGKIHVPNLSLRRGLEHQEGPFGWLVRHFAFSKSNKRDYMRNPPEAVEDLIGAISKRFDLNIEELREEYIRKTHAYIVKFETNDTSDNNLSTALYYLLRKRNGMGVTYNCTSSCSMYSQSVSVVKAEELSNVSNAR